MNTISTISPAIIGVLAIVIAAMAVSVIFMYIIAFIQGREISFWPPKIGQYESKRTEVVRYDEHYFDDFLEITSKKKNKFNISTAFLKEDQCTLMLWILVPSKGELLRKAPNNRYIFSHFTKRMDQKGEKYLNQFCFRFNTRNQWQVTYSNDEGKYPDKTLVINDALSTGWHHFILQWDLQKQIMQLLIDAGRSGSDINRSFLESWPKEFSEKITIGSWPIEYAGHYCETKLVDFAIVYDYLDIKSSIVTEHLKNKPKT